MIDWKPEVLDHSLLNPLQLVTYTCVIFGLPRQNYGVTLLDHRNSFLGLKSIHSTPGLKYVSWAL